jgi:transcription elongation GreA/GreB family factor
VGHALMGRKKGDITSVETPAGTITYSVTSVK